MTADHWTSATHDLRDSTPAARRLITEATEHLFAVYRNADSVAAVCSDLNDDYICNRDAGHPGRHAALAYDAVVAAWPGTHHPVLEDFLMKDFSRDVPEPVHGFAEIVNTEFSALDVTRMMRIPGIKFHSRETGVGHMLSPLALLNAIDSALNSGDAYRYEPRLFFTDLDYHVRTVY